MRFPTTPIHSKPRGGGKYKLGSWELVRQTAMAIANEYWRDGEKEKATKIWEEVKNKDKVRTRMTPKLRQILRSLS